MKTFITTGNPNYRYFAFEDEEQYHIWGIAFQGPPKHHDFWHHGEKNCPNVKEFCVSKYETLTDWEDCKQSPGECFPRIYRGPHSPTNKLCDISTETNVFVGARIVFEHLEQVFTFVEPSSINENCFGHQIRNVYLLACTELEANCIGILEDNGFKKKGNWNIHDYKNLIVPMHLESYTVKLRNYPSYHIENPFESWDKGPNGNPPVWWSEYNKVKHDRHKNFTKATLSNLISSVSALLILLKAQFGNLSGRNSSMSNLDKLWEIENEEFDYIKEFYVAVGENKYCWKKSKLF